MNGIINNRYSIQKKIGKGSFGEVYIGKDRSNGQTVAIKIEFTNHKNILKHEYRIYKSLLNSKSNAKPKIPLVHWYGKYEKRNVLVMEYLGNSLDFLFNYRCKGRFSPKTTVMIGIQILDLLSSLHSCGFIHRDIKPENFLTGIGSNSKLIYLIDLGLAKEYKKRAHIKEVRGKSLVGTARYASINGHLGIELSRRDDLESLGYMLIYFVTGNLPWQGLVADNKQDKYRLIGEKKQSVSLEELCNSSVVPEVLYTYLKYVRSLEFKEKPNYDYLRDLFVKWFITNQFRYDIFDWEMPEY